jgi:hypothetical protein
MSGFNQVSAFRDKQSVTSILVGDGCEEWACREFLNGIRFVADGSGNDASTRDWLELTVFIGCANEASNHPQRLRDNIADIGDLSGSDEANNDSPLLALLVFNGNHLLAGRNTLNPELTVSSDLKPESVFGLKPVNPCPKASGDLPRLARR